MLSVPQEINDKILLKWFKKNSQKIDFIDSGLEFPTQVTRLDNETGQLIKGLDEEKYLHMPENMKILIDLWKTLIGDAIIFLKSKDDRELFHDGEIFGMDVLASIMTEFKEFERLLYGAKYSYRDHIAHVFRVFLTGEFLIRNYVQFAEISVGDDLLPEKVSPEEKEAMWCIMSLTHDIGYALEDIDTINQKIRDMIKEYGKASVQELTYMFPPQRHAIDDFVLRFISSNLVPRSNDEEIEPGSNNERISSNLVPRSNDEEIEPGSNYEKIQFHTHIQTKYFMKFYRAYEKFDHGIISCTVLMRELVFFLESDFLLDQFATLNHKNARQFLIRQNILRAIASHNCPDIYHLRVNDFPFMLMICDELQEWGRPRMEEIFKERIPDQEDKKVMILNLINLPNGQSEVSYEVIFTSKNADTREATKMMLTIEEYFITKTKKYIKVLRSAVGGDLRNINFTFSVKNRSPMKGKESHYRFVLKQPLKGEKKLVPELWLGHVKQKSLQEIIRKHEKKVHRSKYQK
ncbi:MAG: hypothetical protein ABSB83_00730 [Methanomassiliicoccales archaeon]|jgi:hypothetical protein